MPSWYGLCKLKFENCDLTYYFLETFIYDMLSSVFKQSSEIDNLYNTQVKHLNLSQKYGFLLYS